MIDVQKKIRDAFFQSLDGQLTYDGSPVPIVDEKLEDSENNTMYVIMSTQTTVQDVIFSHFDHETTMLLDIVHKTQDFVTKDGIDEVAQQIFDILLPTVTTNGLTAQSGVQITNLQIESDQYFPMQLSATGSVMRRLIRFRQLIHEL